MESNEILAVVDSVSTEKGIDKDLIFKAIEVAIASASQRHFHEDADLYVEINRDTGAYTTHRNWIVFDNLDDEFHHETHISKEDSGLDIGKTYSIGIGLYLIKIMRSFITKPTQPLMIQN